MPEPETKPAPAGSGFPGTMGERLARADGPVASAILAEAEPGELLRLEEDWEVWAHPAQRVPDGDWRVWMMMAGRGFGKTRAGAEWVRGLARHRAKTRIALIGATIAEARAVMVEGTSGLLNIGNADERPRWEPSLGRLVWASGAVATLYSGESPEGLRGPEHHYAWCDEIAKWAHADATWDNLMLGMRLGPLPRTVVTTTPRLVPVLKRILAGNDTVLSRGRTRENHFLPAAYVAAMIEAYGGTRLGRQELDGELIEDAEGALWTRGLIERCRVRAVPETVRVVIGVDPPAGSGVGSDACGIVAVGLGVDGYGYVLGDASVRGKRPEEWAAAVAAAYRRFGADKVVAEKNQGGDMVDSVLRAGNAGLPVELVHASRGKVARAEPVQMLYAKGRVFHAGAFPELEDEMAGLTTGGGYEGPGNSPDRADALVWALSELMLGPEVAEPGVRLL